MLESCDGPLDKGGPSWYNRGEEVKKMDKGKNANKPEVGREELRQLYIEQNLTTKEVASQTGLSVSQVSKRLRRYGIKKETSLIVETINRVKAQNLQGHPKPPKPSKKEEWCVYMHTSPEGKSYIGQTKNTKARYGKDGLGYVSCTKFWQAISRFGWDNFTHTILERGIYSQEEALQREKYWIAFYDTCNNGYNANEGGFMSPIEEKAILQIEPDTLRVVERYRSLQEAVKITGISAPCISQCCSRLIQTAGKFCWCYEEDYKDDWEMPHSSVRRGRRIYCIETGEIFFSPQEVAKREGVTTCCISRVCGSNPKYRWRAVHGKHYCYLGEEGQFQVPHNNNLTSLRCLETGEIFASMIEVAKKYEYSYWSLKNNVKKGKPMPDGKHWEIVHRAEKRRS